MLLSSGYIYVNNFYPSFFQVLNFLILFFFYWLVLDLLTCFYFIFSLNQEISTMNFCK